eukprot:8205248-Ditylum_brightwellii.AAC.1
MELEEYFKQIKLLDNLKQKGSGTIVVDNNSDCKKLSKTKKGKAEPSTKKGGKPNAHKKFHFSGKPKYENKYCVLCKQFGSAEKTHNTKDCKYHKVITEKRGVKRSSEHMSVHELYASSQKLTWKLKNLQKKGKKGKRSYNSDSSDSESDLE